MDAGAGRALEQPVEDHRVSDPMKQEGAQAPASKTNSVVASKEYRDQSMLGASVA